MGDRYLIGAYWGASRETAPEIGGRLVSCLQRLSAVHPALAEWRDRWRSQEEWLEGPKKPWKLDLPTMTGVVESGRLYSDKDPTKPIDDLGFKASGWTGGWDGDEDASVSFRVSAGVHAKSMGPNSFLLEWPSQEQAAPGLYDPATIRSALEVVVESWQPTWAVFTCDRLRDAREAPIVMSMADLERERNVPKDRRAKMPTVGSLIYLRRADFAEIPADKLPTGTKVHYADLGTFVTIGDDPLAATEQDAFAVYRQLEKPFNPHPFTGVQRDPSFDAAAYKARVTATPDGLEYVANGYTFDGYRDGKLLYANDQYEFEAEDGQLKVDQIRDEFLPRAKAQIEAADGYPIVWYFPQLAVARAAEAMLANEDITSIYVRFMRYR